MFFKWAIWAGVPFGILQAVLIDLGIEGGMGKLVGTYLCWSFSAIYFLIFTEVLFENFVMNEDMRERYRELIYIHATQAAIIPAFILAIALYDWDLSAPITEWF